MSSDSSVASKALVEGASLFLRKPVTLKDLKPVWQQVDWNPQNRKKESHQENSEEKGGTRKELRGSKINEPSTTLSRSLTEGNIIKEVTGRPPFKGIIIKEAGNAAWPSTNLLKPIETGSFSIPNIGCEFHGNLFTNPLSQRMQSKGKMTIIIDDENNGFQNIEASNKQEGSNLKRQLSEKEGKKQEKKTKTNLEIVNSGSSEINEKGKKEVCGENNSSNKKAWHSVWDPELHHKFTEAINALGDESNFPFSEKNLLHLNHFLFSSNYLVRNLCFIPRSY